MKMKTNKRKIWVVLVMIFITILTMSSCQMAPIKEIGSMDDLRAALRDYPDILLPDLSGYQMDSDNMSYNVTQWPQDRRVLNGYFIYNKDDAPITLSDGLEFSMFEISCTSIEHYFDDLNHPIPLVLNAQHFGVDLEEKRTAIQTESEKLPVTESGAEGIGLQVPKNTSTWLYSKIFDFNGCRYELGARVFAANGGDATKDFSTEIEQIDDSLLNVIKSIIDQKPDIVGQSSDIGNTEGGSAQ